MVPQRQHAAAAGHSARRLFLCALFAAVTTPAFAADNAPVTVVESNGVYRVEATFAIAQTAAAAIAVLTDFERIPRYVPDMKKSVVLERDADGSLVEQEAVAKFMMFSRRVHLLLRVNEAAGTITFTDTCGSSFAVYEGRWVVKTAGDGATITYQLSAKPTFDVPGLVLKRLLKRDAADLIEKIRTEIATPSHLRK